MELPGEARDWPDFEVLVLDPDARWSAAFAVARDTICRVSAWRLSGIHAAQRSSPVTLDAARPNPVQNIDSWSSTLLGGALTGALVYAAACALWDGGQWVGRAHLQGWAGLGLHLVLLLAIGLPLAIARAVAVAALDVLMVRLRVVPIVGGPANFAVSAMDTFAAMLLFVPFGMSYFGFRPLPRHLGEGALVVVLSAVAQVMSRVIALRPDGTPRRRQGSAPG